MSCCAVVIDSDGVAHAGYESGLSEQGLFFDMPPKMRKIKTGEHVLVCGTARACEKFLSELEKANGDPLAIPKDDWFMGQGVDPNSDSDEWEGAAIIIKDGAAHFIEGPSVMIPIKSPGYYAIGSGAWFALAVLWHMLSGKTNVTEKLALKALNCALEASCALAKESCSPPIIIETLEVA